MKRYLITALVLLVPATTAYSVDIPEEQKFIIRYSQASDPASQGELFDDLDSWSAIPSQLQIPFGEMQRLGLTTGVVCDSVEDSKCALSKIINVSAYLPTCLDSTSQYCVEDFWAIKDGIRINGIFKYQYPNVKTFGQFDAEPKYELPAGGAAGLWQLPGLQHSGGGNFYRVNAQLLGALNRKSTDVPFEKFTPYELWSSISAVSEVDLPGAVAPLAWREGGAGSDTKPRTATGSQCVVASVDKCLLAWPLDLEISYGVKVRMAHPIVGWLHGRLNSPNFSVEITPDGKFHLTMQGNPVKVPTVFAIAPWSELSDSMKARFGGKPSGCCGSGEHWYESAGRNQRSEQMVQDLNSWLPFVKDTASAVPTYWIVRTVSGGGADLNQEKCFKSGDISGVVTTNATAYTSGAPVFNKDSQSLDYQVASPHYAPDGRVNVGNYNLQINSRVARCLYGFTSAPVSATVSVISSNGENQVATTTLKEKDGWIYLSAAGFTFSSPTVRVKLTQEAPVTKPSSDATSASPSVSKTYKKTIVCIKRNSTKRITATNPRCPVGYKKK
ncbi:MAG: hypothetical protein ACKOVI_01395 [Candidatus Planktophila sp.]